MDIRCRDLPSLPNETLLAVFDYLDKSQLGFVRQTCRKLATIAAKPYFRTCTTSFLHLDQLLLLANNAELSQHVEALRFQEMDFNLIDHSSFPDYWNEPAFQNLVCVIFNHHGLRLHDLPISNVRDPFQPYHPNSKEADAEGYCLPSPPKFSEELGFELLCELIAGVLEDYKLIHQFQESSTAFRRIRIAIMGLPNIKRLYFHNARDDGIHVDTGFMPRSLKNLNQYFPVSEGTFHMLFKGTQIPPCQGFLQMISAFEDLDRDIDELVVQHNERLLNGGIPMMSTDDLPFHLKDLAISSFRRLRNLQLTISLPTWLFGNGTDDAIDKDFLRKALYEAAQLKSINLCFEFGRSDLGTYGHILLMDRTFPKLRTLSLESWKIDHPALFVAFLLHRLPALRHLSLHRCRVAGTWEQMFQALSDTKTFTLDSIDVSEPYDEENKGEGFGPSQPPMGIPFAYGTRVPSIVSNESLLHFINTPGSANPFRSRKWRYFDSYEHEEATEQGVESELNDSVFDNISEWEPGSDWESVIGFKHEESDGPEYVSDYDFSIESDSDEDGEDEKQEDNDTEMIGVRR